MNDDKPKSIWKRSWKGLNWLGAWLILVAASLLIVQAVDLFVPGGLSNLAGKMPAWLLLFAPSAVLATIFFFAWMFVRWLCCWKNFRRFLFGLACFATLVALFYAEEDWRGKHDWDHFKRQWEAKGEHFSFASVIPPPVPDDQNFAFSPVWIAEIRYVFLSEPKRARAWYGDQIYSKEVSKLLRLMPVSVSGLVGTNWAYWPKMPGILEGWTTARATAHLTDLKPWQVYYRDLEITNPAAEIPITPQPQSPAADVLLALSKFNPVIEELRQNSARPYSRFPIQYDTDDPAAILLPHLAALKQVAQVLQLRAVAELQKGQSHRAFDDVELALHLVNSIRTEPWVISQLVRLAIFQIALQPIYEGLARHKWSDAQLAELDTQLSEFDFLAGYQLSVRGERAAHIKVISYVEQKRNRLNGIFGLFGDENNSQQNSLKRWCILVAAYLGPKGWFYQNDLVMAQLLQWWDLPVVNDAKQTVSPEKAALADKSIASLNRLTPFNFLARLLIPPFGPFARKAAYGQNSVNLARVAIALERYRLVHGEYPKSLDVLAPRFIAKLPHDIINGQPLHYRRTADGLFVLYSVGWNETDNGGTVVLNKYGVVDIGKGDWVWRYPAK